MVPVNHCAQIAELIMSGRNRDYFVMSKGHSVESYYAVLAAKGFFETETVINEFSQFGSRFIGHPNNELPCLEFYSCSASSFFASKAFIICSYSSCVGT